MSAEFPTALWLIGGAVVIPLIPGWRIRKAWALLLPLLALWQLVSLPTGSFAEFELLGHTLVLMRVDRLSLMFGYVFMIAAALNAVYAMHQNDTVQHVAALVYAASALGAVFAGDLLTLFVFWELTAVSSVFLIWARRSRHSYRAGMRYVLVHLISGMLLLAGAALYLNSGGSLAFNHFTLDHPGAWLLLLAFGIKAGFPLLHNWLLDAYPEATVTGTVVLSAFTTKLGIYALARGFAGTELLIVVGTVDRKSVV